MNDMMADYEDLKEELAYKVMHGTEEEIEEIKQRLQVLIEDMES